MGTQLKEIEETADGRQHLVRLDGSKYPKPTTISLCQSTRSIYSFLRNSGQYHNFNDLLLDIAENAVKTRFLPIDEGDLKELKGYFDSAKIDSMLMARARKYAMRKRRYYRHETPVRPRGY